MRTFEALFNLLRQHRSSPGTLFDEALDELEAQVKAACPQDERIYPCNADGCKVMRSAAEGGNVFTVCDKHWDEGHPVVAEKPEHAKTCQELIPFKCCACGEECCTKHGLPLVRPSKWTTDGTKSVRRCTPCADAGR